MTDLFVYGASGVRATMASDNNLQTAGLNLCREVRVQEGAYITYNVQVQAGCTNATLAGISYGNEYEKS
ncbi:hypothetical protein MNBD_GAMMA11-2253 [hydrothermal vent metagenome]|uniref:Uncharacterized protein n=1 Tax=hydrothermal vent metagenome TaxID=652676 RepID=A0A3B0WVY2_9ZZZZ